ncbi:MAG: gluconate 2-dehydrogenase subunit 3 family protein [Pseudomonadota bacterium]
MTDRTKARQRDSGLTDEQSTTLRLLVGQMIPASVDYGVPGADDPAIFGRILTATTTEETRIADALETLDRMAMTTHGASFSVLDDKDRAGVAAAFAASGSPAVQIITAATLTSYYSDERVMASLGIEERAPFPQGYDVPQGDWSLLDPVKGRPKFFREA